MLSIDYPNGIQMRANTGLKTGLLFKGCIYGISGDWEASKAFLLDFKKNVNRIIVLAIILENLISILTVIIGKEGVVLKFCFQ